MQSTGTTSEPVDVRIRQQAGQLQALLFKLVKIPREHALSDVELSQREIRLLIMLGAHAGKTMTELASDLDAPLSTVTRMVDRLVEKGLVERYRSEENRRSVLVRVSEQGMALHTSCERHHFEIARRMLEPLSFGEREILLELMEKLTRGLGDTTPDR